MNRSPLFYPLNRGGEADGGGAADLQTDIMRFMAILALCLVAVFALVQSLPQAPTSMDASALPPLASERMEMITAPVAAAMRTPRDTARPVINKSSARRAASITSATKPRPSTTTTMANTKPPATKTPAASAPATVSNTVTETRETMHAAADQISPPVQEARSAARPAEPTLPKPVANAQRDETTAAAPAEEGFSLRFASDIALTRLVANNAVGLYAINPQRALRMSVNRGTYSFWPASAPNQFHEMDPGTVPDTVVVALRRSGTLGPDPAVKWGVTLPMKMRQQLNGYLAEQSSGALVIEADGQLRLEQ